MASSDRIDELKKRYDENPRRFFASLANEYRKAGDLDQAIALCQTHLAEQPSNMNGHVVYGQALYEAGRYDEAKDTFETALRLDPENLIALRHLGDIACTNGENAQATMWYERVLDADPRNDEIIALLANLAEEAKKVPTVDAEPPSAEADTPTAIVDPRESRTVEFTPPPRPTPVSNTPVSIPTPVTPIESVKTRQTPAVSAPPVPPAVPVPPRPSLGLMDLSVDFSSAPETTTFDFPTAVPAATAKPEPAAPADDEFPEFEEVSLGVPVEAASNAPDLTAGAFTEAFAETSTVEMEEWHPPVVELNSFVQPPAGSLVEQALEPLAEAPGAAEPDVVPAAEAMDLVVESSTEMVVYSEPVAHEFEPVEMAAVAPAAPAEEPAPPAARSSASDLDLLFGETLPAEPAAPFVTETMAELYLQQGFKAEALDVYQQLSAQNPGDEALRERVRHLEGGSGIDAAVPAIPEQQLGEVEGAVPIGAMAFDDATPVRPLMTVPAPVEPESAPVTTGLTARSYFASLAARRAVQSNGRDRATPLAGAPSVDAPAAPPASAVGSPLAPVPPVSGRSIDDLFGNGEVSDDDENVALAFAQVAGAVEMGGVAVKGRPTAPASTELSLDTVFREADSRGTGSVSRQSQTLRFDQFFATGAEEPPPPPAASSDPVGEPGSAAELQQFQSWLTGLKKP